MYRIRICLYLLLLGICNHVSAQISDHICSTIYSIDTTKVGELYAEIDNLSFFKNNEYSGTVLKGYSLPGMWIQPKLTYNPIKNIHLELGMHALVYSGAYKYPAYAYRDIANWKGDQYQKGTHCLPFYRAQFAWNNVNVVLGNLYGGANHNMIAPLYNQELNLTADPEMGLQILYDLPHFHMDAWIDWQSYIFDFDTHQEAFMVGLSTRVDYTKNASRFHFYTPIQLLVQHRGGEQDDTDMGVQTLSNASFGVGMEWHANSRVLTSLNAEVNLAASYQQAGELWPYGKGIGGYATINAKLWDKLICTASYFVGKDYISLSGIPYYGTISMKNTGAIYDKMNTLFGGLEYSRIFSKYFALGVKLDSYYVMPGTMMDADRNVVDTSSNLSFSFGVFLRVNPRFLIKRFKSN